MPPDQTPPEEIRTEFNTLERLLGFVLHVFVGALVTIFRPFALFLLGQEATTAQSMESAAAARSETASAWCARCNGPVGWVALSLFFVALDWVTGTSIHLGVTYAIPVILAGLRRHLRWALLLAVALPLMSLLVNGIFRVPGELADMVIRMISLVAVALLSFRAGCQATNLTSGGVIDSPASEKVLSAAVPMSRTRFPVMASTLT